MKQLINIHNLRSFITLVLAIPGTKFQAFRRCGSIFCFQFPISIFILLIAFSACDQQEGHEHAEEQAAGITYTCPMHPQIVEKEPGRCPICGMDLVAVKMEGGDAPMLMLSESQILLANIKTQRVAQGGTRNATVLTGRVVENQDLSEVISSRVPGRIERLNVKETGQKIQKGAALYAIYSEELLTYQQEYLLALEQFIQLGDEEPRYASFVESARRKLKLYGMTDAQIRQLETGKKMDPLITMVAPISGVVTDISAVEGQYVPECGSLYTITRLDPLWVEAEVYERDLERIEKGMQLSVQVEGYSRPVQGKIIFVSPEYRASSQIVNMRVEIPNPNNEFIPGMQANVLLPLSGTEEALITVPVDAVVRDQQGAHVWIKSGENTFEPRRVVTSDATAEQVVVSEGLEQDDTVVTSGAYLLYSEYSLKKGGHPLAAPTGHPIQSASTAVETAEDAQAQGQPIFKDKDFAVAFEHYQALKNALIASDPAKAKEQAGALQLALQGLPEGKEAAEYAERIAGTNLLDEQRANFFFLNNNFIEMAGQKELLSGEMYVQFCPMANNGQGAYWLSEEEKIRNPYLPETMLSCGEVTEKIE